MAIGSVTHYSLPVPFDPIISDELEEKRFRGKVGKSRDMKSKCGNIGLEGIGVTVSPSLWVWRSEEEKVHGHGF